MIAVGYFRFCEERKQTSRIGTTDTHRKSKTAVQLTEKQIREFYSQALALEPKLLINYLVKQVTLYDDKIEIQFNAPINISPDDESRRGFHLASGGV